MMGSRPPLATPNRLTTGESNDQHLYFTSSSLTSDGQLLVCLGDRDSRVRSPQDPGVDVNLYALHRDSGDIHRLTDHHDGNYRIVEHGPRRGLHVGSPSMHAESGDLYYVYGRELRRTNAHSGEVATLAELPIDQVAGISHVSDDNTRVCVPTVHESAFRDVERIDATVQELGLTGHLRLFDTKTGAEVADIEVDRAWITHVQFRPGRADTILFNHEWPSDCGVRRMWLWDGDQCRRLRDESASAADQPRHRDDWVCHEVWSRDGTSAIYHGTYASGTGPFADRSFIGRLDPDSGRRTEIAFPAHFRRYGHFNVGPTDAEIVTDGYAEYAPDGEPLAAPPDTPRRRGGGDWISRLDVDWDTRSIDWTALCRHDTSWAYQDAHPHPIVDHSGTEVLFTSDQEGNRSVYSVPLR